MLSCNYSLYIIHTILICFARMDFSEQCHIKDTKIKGKLYKSLKNLYIDQLINGFYIYLYSSSSYEMHTL
jgi:hypothetical protein